jgi:peptide/nickel transport system permease protein
MHLNSLMLMVAAVLLAMAGMRYSGKPYSAAEKEAVVRYSYNAPPAYRHYHELTQELNGAVGWVRDTRTAGRYIALKDVLGKVGHWALLTLAVTLFLLLLQDSRRFDTGVQPACWLGGVPDFLLGVWLSGGLLFRRWIETVFSWTPSGVGEIGLVVVWFAGIMVFGAGIVQRRRALRVGSPLGGMDIHCGTNLRQHAGLTFLAVTESLPWMVTGFIVAEGIFQAGVLGRFFAAHLKGDVSGILLFASVVLAFVAAARLVLGNAAPVLLGWGLKDFAVAGKSSVLVYRVRLSAMFSSLRRSWTVRVLGTVVLVLVAGLLVASVVIPLSPEQAPLFKVLSVPGNGHAFGTDYLGRDVLKSTLAGLGNCMMIALVTSLGAMAMYSLTGIAMTRAGSFGKRALTAYETLAGIVAATGPAVFVLLIYVMSWPGLQLRYLALGMMLYLFFEIGARAHWNGIRIQVEHERLCVEIPPVFAGAGTARLGLGFSGVRLSDTKPDAWSAGDFVRNACVFLPAAIAQAMIIETAVSALGLSGAPRFTTLGRLLCDAINLSFMQWWTWLFPCIALVVPVAALHILACVLDRATLQMAKVKFGKCM